MKKYLIFSLFCVFTFFYGQESFPIKNDKYTIELVKEMPNVGKEEIFNRVLNYFLKKTTPSTFSTIQLKDEQNHHIIAKTDESIETGMLGKTRVFPAWEVFVKDGKYKVIISNIMIVHHNRPKEFWTLEKMPSNWIGRKKHINEVYKVLKEELENFNKSLLNTNNDDF